MQKQKGETADYFFSNDHIQQKLISESCMTIDEKFLVRVQLSLCLRWVKRFCVLSLFTPMARAFRVPTITTKFRPLVTAV